ncbi:MAG: L,D-transpeptidase family protein [Candidatus Omnitrophica bacterium]|nr:L,D-transpeptidase family protein [Candidatus Omnitrophota bacterium]
MKKTAWMSFILVFGLLLTGCGQAVGKAVKAPATPVDEAVKQAQTLSSEGKLLDAKAAYEKLTEASPDYKNIEQVQKELYDINMKLLFSDVPTPQTVIHEVRVGDTLGKICKQYNVTMDLVKESNGLKNDVVRIGQKLRIWTPKFTVHVNKSQNTLMLKSGEDVIKVYNVSTGSNNSTPVGVFKITTKLENPVWFKAGAVIPPESPDNVLGTRWMGFDKEGYGIHGTVAPDKIGQQVTAGCIRMRNEEVEELYKILPRGTEVTIVD